MPATGAPAVRLAPAAAPVVAADTKALQIQATEDGGALISSDQPDTAISFTPSEDGGGLVISELLADGTVGEVVTIVPPVALTDAE